MRKVLWSRIPFLSALILLFALPGWLPAWAATFEYDGLNRLTKAFYQNGTKIEYTYDGNGNRLLRKVLSPLPPQVALALPAGPFGPLTWNHEHTISGTATDRSGKGLTGLEVAISRNMAGSRAYWNGAEWGSAVEIWNPASHGIEIWRYSLDSTHLQEGWIYSVSAKATDGNGKTGYSEIRSFAYDATHPGSPGGVKILDPSSLLLNFTEPLLGAENAAHYHISGGLSVLNVQVVDAKIYLLRLSGPMASGLSYQIHLSSITDLAGNPLEGTSAGMAFQNHAPVAPGINLPFPQEKTKLNQPLLSVSNPFDLEGDSLTYTFEVFSDADHTQRVTFREGVQEGHQTTEWQVDTPLQENTRYWWRARAHDGVFFSAWCNSSFFVNTQNDPPGTPQVQTPAGGAHVSTLTPLLEALKTHDPDSETLTYEFQIFSDKEGIGLVYAAADIVEGAQGVVTCFLHTPLVENAIYHWRVRARDDEGLWGPWSALSAFRVNSANDPPSAPIPLHPAPSQEVKECSMLEIENSKDEDLDPLIYFFEISRDEDFAGPDTWRLPRVPEGGGAGTCCPLSGPLSDNTLYHWRARAFDGKGFGPWSKASFFVNTSNDPPGIPAPREPQGVEVSDPVPVLRVHPAHDPDRDKVVYRYEIYEDHGLVSLVDAGESPDETWTVSKGLTPGKTYFWRACAVDEHEVAGEWAAPSWFTISLVAAPPGIPAVNSPVHKGVVVSHPALISVINTTNAQGYEFELYADTHLKNLLESARVEQGESITSWVPDMAFKDGGTYFWRCRALTDRLFGPWMPTAVFTVSLITPRPEILLQAKQRVFPSGAGMTRVEVMKTGSPVWGARLEIPPQALSEPCDISIGVVENPPALPANTRLVGNVMDLGPDGTVFREPVHVFFPIAKQELDQAGITDLSQLRVLTFMSTRKVWEEVPVDGVDHENRLLFFKVNHFSMFTAVKETEARDPNRPGDERSASAGCFVSGLDSGAMNGKSHGRHLLPALLVMLLLLFRIGRRFHRWKNHATQNHKVPHPGTHETPRGGSGIQWMPVSEGMKRAEPASGNSTPWDSRHSIRFYAVLMGLLLLFPSPALATIAQISASGEAGALLLSASAAFTGYEGNSSGTLRVYHNGKAFVEKGGNGSASWEASFDRGAMPQGDHIYTATAVDSRGITHSESVTVSIDNTPRVTVESPGRVEGPFDFTGTVEFKEHLGGNEGLIEIYIDTTDWRKAKVKSLEGTTIPWSYSGIVGSMLDAGPFGNGEHVIHVRAQAANGAWSEWAHTTFLVDNTPRVTVESPGQVEGPFDFTGTVEFKEHLGGNEGLIEIYIDTTDWRKAKVKSLEGTTIPWSYSGIVGSMLDAGPFGNGEHVIHVRAQAANGAWSEWAHTPFLVDNTPRVTVQSPGKREGLIDITGTATFKEHHGGLEGTVVLHLDSTSWRYEIGRGSFEGTSVHWSYLEMTGNKIDLSKWPPGAHKIYAQAYAANGAASEWAAADLEVVPSNGLVRSYNLGAGAGPCESRPYSGNPINFATGNKFHKETDFLLKGPGIPLSFRRYYNSQSEIDGPLGFNWSISFSERVVDQGDALLLVQADGREVLFPESDDGRFLSQTDELRVMKKTSGGYELSEPEGDLFSFDGEGHLVTVSDRNNNTQTLTHEDGRLLAVEDNFGRRIEFSYNPDGRLIALSSPIGEVDFLHDPQGNLTEVAYPDGSKRRYGYEDLRYPHALTGLFNENGVRYATYAYDAQARAVLSKHAGNTEVVEVQYGTGLKRTLTDSLGREKTFDLHVVHGIGRIQAATGTGCGSCPGEGPSSYDLDDRFRIRTSTDASGAVTKLTFDDRGNILTRTEAFGTPLERTTTYTPHETFALPVSIRKDSLSGGGREWTLLFQYDGNGNLVKKTETGFAGEVPLTRITTYTFDLQGRPVSVDGPRNDVSDTTSLEYYPNSADQGYDRGMLKTLRNALGQETAFSQYNAFGYPGTITDSNGVICRLSYDARGRVLSRTLNGLKTRYDYDPVGNLTAITRPAGGTTSLTYNEINRLVAIEDQEGNSILYTYDSEGNRISEEIYDQEGVLRKALHLEYDADNRLQRVLHPDGASEQNTYDEAGNLTTQTDPNGGHNQYAYDLLRRLTTLTEPGETFTRFGYDHYDHLASITDPGDNTTAYTYDDLGRLLRTVSPDTNTTAYTFDESDNLLSSTDGSGITTAYQYDALNRLTKTLFPDSSETITFLYDENSNGKGRLSSMVDQAGRTDYTYDELGRTISEKRTMHELPYTTQYTYDGNGSLLGMTCPGGLVVAYERDSAGKVSLVKINGQVLAAPSTHLPFGPRTGLTLGSGLLTMAKTYDQRYQLKRIQAGSPMDYQYTHDPAGNILSISGVTEPIPDNETSHYGYGANRLTSITGASEREYTYDGAGNILTDGTFTFTYNQSGRLVKVAREGEVVAEYAYDGLARRVRKTVSGKSVLFHYDRQANLISETTLDGTPLRDFIYLDGERIAMKLYGDQAGIYYFLNDHLGTPHMLINSAGEIVWHAAYLPFGQAQILTEKITNPFRFPGQYHDPETNLHYNYFRYYDPATGRYLTPDPLLLTPQDPNAYVYARANPIKWLDATGLFSKEVHKFMTSQVLAKHTTDASIAQRVVEGNIYVDRTENQLNNSEHGMRDIGQTRLEAQRKSYEAHRIRMRLAIEAARDCDMERALFELGQGLHTIQDEIAHDFITIVEHMNPLATYNDYNPTGDQMSRAFMASKMYVEEFMRAIGYDSLR